MKRRLSTPKMFLLALAFVGTGIMITTISQYTLRFFAPTEQVDLPLLVPIGWIGIIQGIALAFDCLIDPFIASWGDNSTNPKGRRMPFMRLSFIPAAVFCILVFFVPVPEVSVINAIWVLVMFLAYSFTRSLFDISLQALIPEIIPDEHRRVRFFAVRTAIGLIGTLLAALVPGVVEGMQAGGIDALAAWRICLSAFPVLGIVFMVPALLTIRETDYVDAAPASQQRLSIWTSIREALSVRPFRHFITAGTFFGAGANVSSVMLLFYVDVLFGMEGGMGTIIFLVLILASFLFYPVVLPLSKRMGKKPLVIAAVAVCVVGYAIIFFYEPIGALLGTAPVEPGGFWAGLAGEGVQSGYVTLLLIIGVLFGFPITAGNLLNNGICTDIIQYHAIRKGRTYSGIFAAAQNVIFSIPSTLVPAMTGLLIYLGTTNDMPTVLGVQSTAILAVILVIPAVFFYRLYNEREILSVIRSAGTESSAVVDNATADKDGGDAEAI